MYAQSKIVQLKPFTTFINSLLLLRSIQIIHYQVLAEPDTVDFTSGENNRIYNCLNIPHHFSSAKMMDFPFYFPFIFVQIHHDMHEPFHKSESDLTHFEWIFELFIINSVCELQFFFRGLLIQKILIENYFFLLAQCATIFIKKIKLFCKPVQFRFLSDEMNNTMMTITFSSYQQYCFSFVSCGLLFSLASFSFLGMLLSK